MSISIHPSTVLRERERVGGSEGRREGESESEREREKVYCEQYWQNGGYSPHHAHAHMLVFSPHNAPVTLQYGRCAL
jgi:hypothetical protein